MALASHPVQYQSHLYRAVAADPRVDLTVLFASNAGVRSHRDAGFGGHTVQWDIDLLGGYKYRFLRRADRNGIQGFFALRDLDVTGEIDTDRCDVLWVHGYSYLTMWLAIGTARARRIPLMIREEQTLIHGRPWWKRYIRATVLRILFRGVTALAIGSNNRAFFSHYGVPENRIFFVPYTTNNSWWQAEASRLASVRGHIRASFGIRPSLPVIAFVGKLQHKKQPRLLLEAFRLIRQHEPCALLFVGTGPLEGELRRTVLELSIPDVIFAGFLNQSEVSRAYAAADIFVLPSSRNETWGIAVNEAMNFGLPIVVSDKVGCRPDLVHDGDNGFVFDCGSVEDLTRHLTTLVRDPESRARLGRRSRAVISLWSPEVAAKGLVAAAIASAGQGSGRGHAQPPPQPEVARS